MKKVQRQAVLAVVIILLLSAFPAYAQQTYSESAYADAVNVLAKLGLWDNFFDTVLPSDTVDRKMFSLLVKAAYGDKNTYGGDFFNDCPKSEPFCSAVNFAASNSLMSGNGENFNPDTVITFEQALKVAVAMLGKSELAENRGGYPDGYISEAFESNLTNGISAGYNEALLFGTAVTLIYNTVHSNVSIRVPDMGHRFEYKDGELFITRRLDIAFGTGKLNQSGRYSLLSESAGSDMNVTVEKNVMLSDDGSAYRDYLGFFVEYWCKKDNNGNYEIIHMRPHSRKNNVEVIQARDIADVKSTYAEYFDDDGGKVKLDFDFNCSFVYNGRLLTKPDKQNLVPTSGRITAIDNNGDYLYDVLDILSYDGSYIAETVSASNETITDLFGRTLCLSGDNVIIKKYGKRVSFSEIKAGDIITTAKSCDGGFITVYVSDNTEIGTVSEVSDGKIYVINGVERFLSADYKSNLGSTYAPALSAGSSGKIYYDEAGNIAAAFLQNSDMQYGYVIAKSDGSDFRQSYCIKLLTEYDGVKEYVVPQTLTLNKVRKTAADMLNMPGLEGSVIKFKTNNNEITTVITADAGCDFSCDLKGKTMAYRNGGRCFDGRYSMGLDSRIMYVTGRDSDGDNGYYVSPKINIGDLAYNVDIYDTDEFNIIGLAVIRLDKFDGKIMLASERPAMVKELDKALKADGTETYRMTLIYKGKEFSYTLQSCNVADIAAFYNETPTEQTRLGVDKGDIILFRTHDTTGEIVSIEKIYSVNTNTFNEGTLPYPSDYNGKYRYSSGKLKSLKEGIAVLELPDGTLENYYVLGKCFGQYDKNSRASVYLSDITALYDCLNSDEWNVVLYMHYSVVYDVYLYRR